MRLRAAAAWASAVAVIAGLGAGGAVAATQWRATDVARLEGWEIARGDAWSPSGAYLAVVSRSQLALWDAGKPDAAPRVVLEARVDEVRWSPDGSWLCCRVRVSNAVRGGAVRLQFVEAASGATEYRIPNAAIGPWTWADDGFVYFWQGQTGERRRLDPPRAWLDAAAAGAAPAMTPEARPQLVQRASTERGRRTRAVLFVTGAAGQEPVETPVDSIVSPGGVRVWCRVRDPRTGAWSFVCTFLDRKGGGETYRVDVAGRKQERLFDGRALGDVTGSPDGHYVLAATCNRPRDGSAPECEVVAAAVGAAPAAAAPIDALRGAARVQHSPATDLTAAGTGAPTAVRVLRLER